MNENIRGKRAKLQIYDDFAFDYTPEDMRKICEAFNITAKSAKQIGESFSQMVDKIKEINNKEENKMNKDEALKYVIAQAVCSNMEFDCAIYCPFYDEELDRQDNLGCGAILTDELVVEAVKVLTEK